jgi:hypothetical protein
MFSDRDRLLSTNNQMFRNVFQNTTAVESISNSHVTMNYLDPHYSSDVKFIKIHYPGLEIRHVNAKQKSSNKSQCLVM